MRALGAGIVYVVAVFAAGAVLGVIRALLLEPWLGPLAAVLIALPAILGFAWVACGRLAGWFGVPAQFWPRLGMGLVSFAVLIGAEFIAAVARDVDAAPVALYGDSAHRIGLAGQVVFALMPLLRLARPRPR